MPSSRELRGALAHDRRPRRISRLTRRELKDLEKQERTLRLGLLRWLPSFVAVLVVLWLVFVVYVTLRAGKGTLELHSSVLVALLGSATASIIGLLMKVVGYALPSEAHPGTDLED